MLFHVGALWRLNQLGRLREIDRLSSVSGGSITNAVLALAWNDLRFDQAGVATEFESLVVDPIRAFARRTIDWPAILGGLFTADSAADLAAAAYDEHLFRGRTLQDLPSEQLGQTPRFVFNATNVQSGALFRFSKRYIRDWRVGEIANPRLKISAAVAASAAFPPFLSPLRLNLADSDWTPRSGDDLQHPPFTTNPTLTDGGVYDNLGIETVFKRYRTILVSDGGGRMKAQEKPWRDWLFHTKRVLDVVDNQVRSLRKRQLIAAYQLPRNGSTTWRAGTYWGIRTDIADYHLADALPCPHDKTIQLADEPTRLCAMDDRRQEQIINWGYAVCDAAMRRWMQAPNNPHREFPFPRAGVG